MFISMKTHLSFRILLKTYGSAYNFFPVMDGRLLVVYIFFPLQPQFLSTMIYVLRQPLRYLDLSPLPVLANDIKQNCSSENFQIVQYMPGDIYIYIYI
jgi:hypothetical protein